jgi:NADPH-dependent curcumin reductase CurA
LDEEFVVLSREVRLAVMPDGLPRPEHFVVVDVPVPVAGPGQVLVRNKFFQVSARLRMLMSSAIEGVPLPAVRPGDSPPSAAVGEVVVAPEDSGLRPGELVSHRLGWRDYAVLPVAGCVPIGDVLPDPVAYLGSGWPAYAALTRCCQLRPGESVLVTGGAGGVGSLAGQIARRLGAAQVIGSTTTPEKADRMISELGYDAVVVRGAGPFATQLAHAAPDGIDVVVDTVGGEQLPAAVTAARPGARFALVGTLSSQLAPHGFGVAAPVELDAFPLMLKGVHLYGFTTPADPAAQTEWTHLFGDWLRSGEITFPHVRVRGIDHAAQALHEVINRRHMGTVVVEL